MGAKNITSVDSEMRSLRNVLRTKSLQVEFLWTHNKFLMHLGLFLTKILHSKRDK